MPDVGVQGEAGITVSVVVPRSHVMAMEHPAVKESVVIGVSSLPSPSQVRVGVRTAVGVVVPRSKFGDSYSPQLRLIQGISPDFKRAGFLVLLGPAICMLVEIVGLPHSPEYVLLIAVFICIPPNQSGSV